MEVTQMWRSLVAVVLASTLLVSGSTATAASQVAGQVPPEVVDLYNHAADRFWNGDHAEAMAAFSQILARVPEWGRAYCGRGYSRAMLGDLAAARDDMELCARYALEHADPATYEYALQVLEQLQP
jgi:hypothetical protein